MRGFAGERMRSIREQAGMSRADLARYADLSVGAIRSWEVDGTNPQVDTLARAAAALGVEMGDLVVLDAQEMHLSDLRVLAGLTQPQLAVAAGLSTTALAGLEQGHVRLRPDHVNRLASALHVAPELIQSTYERSRKR